MAGAKKRRQKHQNKTKARLIEELEALQREVARQKRGAGGKGVGAANSLLESEEFFQTFFDHSPTALFVRDLKAASAAKSGRCRCRNPVMKAGGLGNASERPHQPGRKDHPQGAE